MSLEQQDVGQDDRCPFGPELQYCWDMRQSLFSRYRDGIQVDAVGLFGVKPEQAALESARALPGATVLDAFCGIGGSAIAFARAGKRVMTVDIDRQRLEMARHNARLYQVEDRILFVNGDTLELIRSVRADCVYMDPPWGGGPDFHEKPTFRLKDFVLPVEELLGIALERFPTVSITVPPTFDFDDLRRQARGAEQRVRPVELDGELLYYDVFLTPRH